MDYFSPGQLVPDHGESLLQQIQEIDYLAPAASSSSSSSSSSASRHAPRGHTHGHPLPIFQKVVLSREQLLQRLQEASAGGSLWNEAEQDDEEDEEDRQLRMLRQLVEQTMKDS